MDLHSLVAPPAPERGSALAELARIVERFSPIDGEHRTAIEPLTFHRYSAPSAGEYTFSKVALIFAAQGAKQITAGHQSYRYDTAHCLVVSIDLPIVGRVIEASRERPYLCFALELDIALATDLVVSRDLPPPDAAPAGPGISAGALPPALLDAACRLARLLDTPRDIPTLAPLIQQEIIYRVLTSSQGARLRDALVADSRTSRIGRAVEWVKAHYAAPLRLDVLASHVNMSVSSLHRHFKDSTSLSPLQYQKRLRLFEARRRLMQGATDLGVVAAAVGYDSLSQFHREYKRLFGAPPMQDAVRLRTERR